MIGRAVALAGLVLMVAATPAAAHQASVTYNRATVVGDEVDYQIEVAAADLAEPAGLPADVAATPATFTPTTWADVGRYVTAHVRIASEAGPCAPVEVQAGPDPNSDGAVVAWRARCARPIAQLTIEYQLFFDLDPAHQAALQVTVPGQEPADTILVAEAARFVWDLGQPPPSDVVAFVRAGVHHVATGLDHVAFVLALLIAIVIAPAGDGWRRRGLPAALRTTATTVSAFTVAHSLTLIAAALGWVSLPARLVEVGIAGSIVWTAVAAVARPERAARWPVAFTFGLMHGLGFARMLAPLLPRDAALVPLVAFNVGVELAQLAVVGVALPTAWLAARALGAARYRRWALPAVGAVLAGLGAVWLVERVAGLTLLGL
ncbi:MAG: HupE/UreJ family protein [Kofleriaceae bacterium]